MNDEASIEMTFDAAALMPPMSTDDLNTPTSDSRIRVRRRSERTAKWKAKGQAARALDWRRRRN
jgi:hypothetical protein